MQAQRTGSTQLSAGASAGAGSNDVAKGKKLSQVNIAAFAVNAVIVGLSQFGVFGKGQAQVSFDHETLVTPLAPTFAVWGFIYTAEAAFVLWQASKRNRDSKLVQEGVGPWFAVACVLQAVWSLFFSQEKLLTSSLILVAIAGCLTRASIGLTRFRSDDTKAGDYLVTAVPIGVHAGWTFAAAIININAFVQSAGASAHTQLVTAVLSLAACIGSSLVATFKFKDDSFVAAIVWALLGIWAKGNVRHDLLSKAGAGRLGTAVLTSAIALGGVTLLNVRKRLAKSKKTA